MKTSSFIFKYLLPAMLSLSFVYLIVDDLAVLACIPIFVIFAFVPRIYIYFDKKNNFIINSDSSVSRFFYNIDILSPENRLSRYFKILYGFPHSRDWLFRFATLNFMIFLIIGLFTPVFSFKHAENSNIISIIIALIFYVIVPLTAIIIHVLSLKKRFIDIIAYSIVTLIVFYFVTIASYFALVLLIVNFFIILLPLIFLSLFGFRRRDNYYN